MEYFKIALRNLKSRSLRSWLTIFGIIIGVFLIISLISLSEGLEKTIMAQLKTIGKDLIFVMPGGDVRGMMVATVGGMELTNLEIKAIERTRGVEQIVLMPYGTEVVRYEGTSKMVLLAGVSWDKSLSVLKEDMGYQLAEGDFPKSGKREVLVGNLISQNIFPGIKVGDQVNIKGRNFRVSGILMSTGERQNDLMTVLDLDDFQQITGKRDGAPVVIAKIDSSFEMQDVIENIKDSLAEVSKRKSGDQSSTFSVVTSETIADMVGGVMAVIKVVVIAFASIALVVGGIGIMNTMYTSVRERTREVGIMKALGAQNSVVLFIFLIESAIIGVIGGVGGIFLGVIFAKSIEFFGKLYSIFHISASVSPGLIIFGLTFSLFIGCLSGILPARQAAQLKPVEALRRYE